MPDTSEKQAEMLVLNLKLSASATGKKQWSKGVCPNCGYTKADVDPDGIIWCPACGYSKKGCYT
jgi:rubrerythrin